MSTKAHGAPRYVGTAAERAAQATPGLVAGTTWIETDTQDIYWWSGAAWFNSADWPSGNITYVPLTGDIQAYIDAAVAGDTLILGSGVYNITSTITVDKQLNIVGQGNSGLVTAPITPSHGTLVSSATAGVTAFQIDSDNVRIAHMSVNLTGAGSKGVNTANNLSGIVFNTVDVIVTCSGAAQGFTLLGTNAVLRDLTFYITSTDSTASGALIQNNAATTQAAVVDCFNVTGTAVGAAGYAYALACLNTNNANTLTLNLSNSVCRVLTGTPNDVALISYSVTTNNAIVNCYLCTLDGADYDAYQTGTNELNLGGSVLVNDSAFGTVTYRAAMVASTVRSVDLALTGEGRFYEGVNYVGFEAPALVADQIWVLPDADGNANEFLQTDGAGNLGWVHIPTFKSYNVTTQGLGAGPTIYAAGYYESNAADANLDQAGPTATFGTANASYAAHAFIVAGGAGVTDGSDLVLTVSGVSITDAGIRTVADSEVIVADCTAAALNGYYETTKKWLGQITYTLTSTAGTAFSFDFNYGFAKYEDFGNIDFTVTDFEAVGYAGANEANFDIELLHHSITGWTYNAAAFVPGGTVIVQLSTDHSTDDQLVSGEHFAFKRAGFSTAITGSGSEGVLARVTTTANNAIEYLNIHIGITL
jgi:hypothetical protein